jgi:polyisoprenoid-binding protein YceI
MSRGMKIGLVAVLGLVLLAAAGIAYVLLADDSPPPVDQADAADIARADQSDSPGGSVAHGPELLDGTWVLTAGSSDDDGRQGSFVGYRVQEELAGIGAAAAVGQSGEVAGSLLIEGEVASGIDVTVDMTTLESDDSRRDGQMRSQGLETNEFPEAAFVTSEPIDFGGIPAPEEVVVVDVDGELTLHGVTRPVVVALSAEVVGEVIVVTGSFDVLLEDYDIAAPSSFAVLSVADEGTVEFQLFFAPA